MRPHLDPPLVLAVVVSIRVSEVEEVAAAVVLVVIEVAAVKGVIVGYQSFLSSSFFSQLSIYGSKWLDHEQVNRIHESYT